MVSDIGEPSYKNNLGFDENCVEIYPISHRMKDSVCQSKRHFICQKRNLSSGTTLKWPRMVGIILGVIVLICLLLFLAYRVRRMRKVGRNMNTNNFVLL